jgi:hypothetical protein
MSRLKAKGPPLSRRTLFRLPAGRLYTDLRALGWPDDEIAIVVKDPRAALACGYGNPEGLREPIDN